MLSWVPNCSLVNPSYYPEQINSIAGRISIISWFRFPRKKISKIDSSAVLQLPIAVFDCIVLPSVTIRIKLLSLVQFSDPLLLGRCSVMPSDSQLWYFMSNGIISRWNCYLSWERDIHKAGRRQIIYIFPYLLCSALKIKLFSYMFKSSSHCKNVGEIERKTWSIEITQNTGNSGLQMDLRKTQLCHSTED